MKLKQVIFIPGGGDNGYQADKSLVLSLKKNLGSEFEVQYPEILSNENKPDFGWIEQLGGIVDGMRQEFILVAHSFGASMVLKYVSENYRGNKIHGVFLLSTPFWNGNEEWQSGLKLKEDFIGHLPNGVPIFFYHCEDDQEVPVSHLTAYKTRIHGAGFREIKTGGHQFNNDLALIARDIRKL